MTSKTEHALGMHFQSAVDSSAKTVMLPTFNSEDSRFEAILLNVPDTLVIVDDVAAAPICESACL